MFIFHFQLDNGATAFLRQYLLDYITGTSTGSLRLSI